MSWQQAAGRWTRVWRECRLKEGALPPVPVCRAVLPQHGRGVTDRETALRRLAALKRRLVSGEKSCGKHPTQKPLGVLARLIQASTKPGEWILDPFSGSGTTGIAANLLGRRYLGLELEDDFLAMSMARRMEIENEEIRKKYLARINGIIHNA